MTIKLYDTVLLKDGRKGTVVDRMGNDYIVDVNIGGDFDTRLVSLSDIVNVIV